MGPPYRSKAQASYHLTHPKMASSRPWYHKHLGRMETEKLLMESREDGSFLIRESDTVKGAYVLSTM